MRRFQVIVYVEGDDDWGEDDAVQYVEDLVDNATHACEAREAEEF